MVRTERKKSDRVLLFSVFALMALGCVMVYSASSYSAKVNYGNEYFYLFKQLAGAALGALCAIAFGFFDYRKLVRFRIVILIASFCLLALVFVPGIGVENYGAKRWIRFPFFTVQPSETAKFGLVIYCAAYAAKKHEALTTFKGLIPILAAGTATCALVIAEPNMSITVCVALVTACMLFICGAKKKHLALIALPAVAAVPLLIVAEPYRFRRLMAFVDPWQSPLEEGYQLVQSFYALAGGGFWGLGLFNSRQKYLFLPFSESDFIFSVIGEELGFFGCVCVIAAYSVVVWRCFRTALKASDRFGAYLSAGVGCVIAVQVIVNIAVVSGTIPPTGLPLPFVSAGTSSLIAFCSAIGLVNGVKRNSDLL